MLNISILLRILLSYDIEIDIIKKNHYRMGQEVYDYYEKAMNDVLLIFVILYCLIMVELAGNDTQISIIVVGNKKRQMENIGGRK